MFSKALMNSFLKVGLAKSDMTCFVPGLGMMGYGQDHNRVQDIATPLTVRACVIEQQDRFFIYACLEQCFVTIALSQAVIERVCQKFPQFQLSAKNFIISAQHTHSAPGGYGHYPLYNFTIPGFQPQVFEKVVCATTEAICEAILNRLESEVRYGEYFIPIDKQIAFNRSLAAYQLNPEATGYEKSQHAVDRLMRGLKIYRQNKLVGMLNFFGVHCTSVSSYNQSIHHDNKGVAAKLFEEEYPAAIGIFAQAASGDISPNWIIDAKTKLMRGVSANQYESADYNGRLQFEASENLADNFIIKGEIRLWSGRVDMTQMAALPAHGVAFFMGTAEGPGLPKLAGKCLALLAKIIQKIKVALYPALNKNFYHHHGAKSILLDHRSGEFVGIPQWVWSKLPNLPDPVVRQFQRELKLGALATRPWVPYILPLQVTQIGQILILGVPGEITTIAAERLKAKIVEITAGWGIEKIILSSFANAYMGYITTPEEYALQCYEGGHTVYGQHTLAAIIDGFEKLLTGQLPDMKQHQFPVDELKLRSA